MPGVIKFNLHLSLANFGKSTRLLTFPAGR
jgi:hypothetical protein